MYQSREFWNPRDSNLGRVQIGHIVLVLHISYSVKSFISIDTSEDIQFWRTHLVWYFIWILEFNLDSHKRILFPDFVSFRTRDHFYLILAYGWPISLVGNGRRIGSVITFTVSIHALLTLLTNMTYLTLVKNVHTMILSTSSTIDIAACKNTFTRAYDITSFFVIMHVRQSLSLYKKLFWWIVTSSNILICVKELQKMENMSCITNYIHLKQSNKM